MDCLASDSGSRLRVASALGLVAALGWAAAAGAQGGASGPELQVNTYTTDAQQGPAVGMDAQGNFVVVWQSWGSSETDTYRWSMQARRFAAGGAPLAGQFQVNFWTYNNRYIQHEGPPAVAMSAQGDFVVGFGDSGCASPYPYSCYYGMVAVRRFDASGAPLGTEFDVNQEILGSPPELARAANTGNFVVVWSGSISSGNDNSGESVQARRYNGDWQALSNQFQVNTYSFLTQNDPAVAAAPSGGFVVVWASQQSGGPDNFRSIEAQRFDANGAPQGAEFQVNTYTTGYQEGPSVAVDPVGNFVVVWESTGSTGTDTSGRSIQARRFAADGTPLGDDFQVNFYATGSQDQPGIAIDAEGNFLVVWRSNGSGSTDTDSTSIQAQWFDAGGNAQGDQFQVNTYTTSAQDTPSVAVRDRDNFVVVWESDGSGGTDTSAGSIHARAWGLPFLDGFETGDTSRWTNTVP